MLRWCTWNLWAIGPEPVARTDAAQRALEQIRPDLCCLQEVRADSSIDVAERLAAATGLHLGRGEAVGADWWSGRVGEELRVDNVILSRWPIEELSVVELACREGSSEQRSAVMARVATPEGAVRVVSLQLSSSPVDSAVRMGQVDAVAHAIRATGSPDETVLVAGDLNAEPDSDEVRHFCGHKTPPIVDGFVVLDLWRYADPVDPGWTWDRANPHVLATREPSSRIDHLLAGPTPAGTIPGVERITRFADRPIDGTWASDHAGVVTDLEL
jgi:endonuclease/exonuclease/phosphatase family metal-dependent hydrolase